MLYVVDHGMLERFFCVLNHYGLVHHVTVSEKSRQSRCQFAPNSIWLLDFAAVWFYMDSTRQYAGQVPHNSMSLLSNTMPGGRAG